MKPLYPTRYQTILELLKEEVEDIKVDQLYCDSFYNLSLKYTLEGLYNDLKKDTLTKI